MRIGGGPDTWEWLARLLQADGRAAGTGFLVDDRHILTCAHVVAALLGTGEPPAGSITLDFPAWPKLGQIVARVESAGWFPVAQDQTGDLAVLAIDGLPGDMLRAPLRRPSTLFDHRYRCHGFPTVPPGGRAEP